MMDKKKKSQTKLFIGVFILIVSVMIISNLRRQKVLLLAVLDNAGASLVETIEGDLVAVFQDGQVVSWDWDFGDGSDHSDQQHPTHSYLLDDSYVVTLTVTDDDGEADSTSQTVNVSDGSSGGITLTASGYKVKGVHHADLEWFDAPANVDIYRDTEKIVSGISLSTYTDNIGNKGAGSYTYKVCEAGSTTSCSNEATVNF